jgi:hypothetical protein
MAMLLYEEAPEQVQEAGFDHVSLARDLTLYPHLSIPFANKV